MTVHHRGFADWRLLAMIVIGATTVSLPLTLTTYLLVSAKIRSAARKNSAAREGLHASDGA